MRSSSMSTYVCSHSGQRGQRDGLCTSRLERGGGGRLKGGSVGHTEGERPGLGR